MTQDEAWKKNYDEVMSFITENGRNLSKYNLEERRLYTWLKHQRKVMNAGEMKEERITPFKKLLELSERYIKSGQIRGTGTFIHSLYTNKHNIFPQELLSNYLSVA